MKRTKLMIPAAVILAVSISLQSCIGSFSLTNKVLTWNNQVSNKFLNELVFFAFWILPVYEVTAAADLLVINSIEFWSGNNPMEARNRVIDTDQGDYLIASDENGYKITSPNGDILEFSFDKESRMWSFSKNNAEKIDFLQFEDDQNVKILNGEGEFVDVEISEQGVRDYKAQAFRPMMALR